MAYYPRPDDLASMLANHEQRIKALEHPTRIRAGVAQLSSGAVTVYSDAITPASAVIVGWYQFVTPMASPGQLVHDNSTAGRLDIVATNSAPGNDALIIWAIVD